MAKGSSKIYWVENAEIGQDFVTLDDKHNFYWDKDGNLVIVFDKYEVAPGSMGAPEFVIKKGAISDILNDDIPPRTIIFQGQGLQTLPLNFTYGNY